jgi:hypothetical protein
VRPAIPRPHGLTQTQKEEQRTETRVVSGKSRVLNEAFEA